MKNRMRPIHPGEILREEYLVPLSISADALAGALRVRTNRISGIIAGKRSVTADTALRLARAFNSTPDFWLNLQQHYDLRIAETTAKGIESIRAVLPLRKAKPRAAMTTLARRRLSLARP